MYRYDIVALAKAASEDSIHFSDIINISTPVDWDLMWREVRWYVRMLGVTVDPIGHNMAADLAKLYVDRYRARSRWPE